MAKDVVSYVARDTKPLESESLEVLLVATDGVRVAKTYRDLESIQTDFPDVSGKPSKIYRKASALFDQGTTSKAEALYRKVKIVGFAAPKDPADLVNAIESFRENDDAWNILLTDRDESTYVQSLIAYAESTEPTIAELMSGVEDHRKTYFAQTTDKDFTYAHARGVVIWVNSLDEEADAAYVGNVAPFYPTRVTWKFKTPQGVTLANLTEGEKDALDEQNVNYLAKEYGFVYIKNGVCADGEFIDVLLGADYCAKRVRDKVYTVLTTEADVPYTDDGFTLIGSGVVSALNDAVDNHIIAKDSESGAGQFEVAIPVRSEVSEEQARARLMPDIHWSAVVEGAVHRTVVRGVLTTSLATT